MQYFSSFGINSEYGFTDGRYGNALAFWLPEHLELKDIISRFEGIEIDGR